VNFTNHSHFYMNDKVLSNQKNQDTLYKNKILFKMLLLFISTLLA